MTFSTTLTERASTFLDRKTGRRSFLTRTAMVGSALTAAGADFVLKPNSAYAAVCSCNGRSCNCTDLCCDGYTEFCCQIYGENACPPNTLLAGWWKVDNSSYCAGSARYYMDCNKASPACACGSSGVCRGSDTTCQCRQCGNRKDGCTAFRYGNCNNHVACVGPIMCRVVTCTKPWEIDPGCTTVARTDNNTRHHHRPCLSEPTEEQLNFIEALYHDFLGRSSDASGRDYWGDVLAGGAGQPIGLRDVVASSFAFSIEYATTVVNGLYQLALDRRPDSSGKQYWVDQLLGGLKPRELAVELFGSDEFYARVGKDDATFITELYRRVLGRTPSASERSYWQSAIADSGRGGVARSLYQSVESRRRRVSALYQRFLGRQPDTSGRDYWVDVIATREDISVALYITAGPEYLARAQRRFG